MKTNLVSLRLIKNQSQSIRIALKYQDQPDDYESFWVIGKNEIDYVIRRLTGKEPMNLMVDDLNYNIGFYTDGIKCNDHSNSKFITHYVTFPGQILADALTIVKNRPFQEDYKKDDENVYTVSQDTIDAYAYESRNKARVVYSEYETHECRDAIIRLCKDEKTKDYFRRQLKSFIRQAGEHRGTFNISLDSYQDRSANYPSFYFWLMTDDNRRIYNGGIINHSRNPEMPDYSIHT